MNATHIKENVQFKFRLYCILLPLPVNLKLKHIDPSIDYYNQRPTYYSLELDVKYILMYFTSSSIYVSIDVNYKLDLARLAYTARIM